LKQKNIFQLGFVKTNAQVRIQTCPGSVPTADKIGKIFHVDNIHYFDLMADFA
jgi:hypothetical protein